MEIKINKVHNVVIAQIIGDLDHHSCEVFRTRLDSLILTDNYNNIILDFSALSFMDSSGLGAIMGRYKLCKNAGGTLVISGADKHVERLLELGGLTRIIKLCSSLQAAKSLMA